MNEMSEYVINPISIELIYLSDTLNHSIDDQNSECYAEKKHKNRWRIEEGRKLQTILRRVNNISAVNLELLTMGNNNSGKSYLEDEGVCRYSGEFECERCDRSGVKKTIASICAEQKMSNTWISLNNDTYKWLSGKDNPGGYQTLNINSFKFGTLVDLTQFIKHYDSNDKNLYNSKLHVARDDIAAEFQNNKKRLLVRFRLSSGGANKRYLVNIRYKLEYDYSSFNSVVVCAENGSIKIYFILNHPPILYMLENDLIEHSPNFKSNNRNNNRSKNNNSQQQQQQQQTIGNNSSFDAYTGVHTDDVNASNNWIRDNEFYGVTPETLGKCNVLVIDIPQVRNENNLRYKYSNNIPDPWSALYMLKHFGQIPIYFASISEHKCINSNEINYLTESISLPFSVNYAYNALFSHTYQSSDELFLKYETAQFIEKVEEYTRLCPKAIEETLFQLLSISDRCSVYRTLSALQKIFVRYKKKYDKIRHQNVDINSFNTEVQDIRRCLLTPTRLILLPPQPTLKSRFIVNAEPDYSVRLAVREDNLLDLSFTVQRSGSRVNQINFIKKIVKIPLMNSLKIGNRMYEFLGSSSSQLRDYGMILYAKDSFGRTASSIRDSVGDMSKLRRNVPKYVARLGLVFSQAMTHITIDKSTKVDVYPDIEGYFKPDFRDPNKLTKDRYVFSDGIGMVSEAIAEKVYQQLPNESIHRPIAMQIRFGGCKGMLVVNPKLKGEHIIFRESMKKFESNDRSLGILKLSAARPVYLNRPLIAILEQLKIEPQVFLGMLASNLKCLANSLVCECSAFALLQNSSSLCIPYEKLYTSGIPFLREPIFRQIVDCLIPYRIKELKSKARIKVPMENGRIAFGVLDETGSLEYGQIFAKLTHFSKDGISSDKYFILDGEVMVTKFPCLHPGDVRKLTAVNIPALHHIKDCIVFPGKGSRPHTDEMAGSDLDGDEYAVFWNIDLIFDGPNMPPMHFPTGNAQQLDHEVEVEDILNFYCDYILSNNVGLLANAHLANADFLADGIFSKVCMSLAAKYAVALDFSKTGIVEPIDIKERPKLYPDFMEKFSEKRTYLSNKVLGQLYRQCCAFEMCMQSKVDLDIKAQPNPRFELNGWETYEESATNAFILYKDKISYLLNKFGVVNEAALLSGAYTKTNKFTTGRSESNDMHELLDLLVGKVFTEFNARFKSECGDDCDARERQLRASSWYMMSYKLNQNLSPPYFGFAWTVTDELCKIIETNNNNNNNNSSASQLCSSEIMHDCVHNNSAQIFDNHLLLREDVLHSGPSVAGDQCCEFFALKTVKNCA